MRTNSSLLYEIQLLGKYKNYRVRSIAHLYLPEVPLYISILYYLFTNTVPRGYAVLSLSAYLLFASTIWLFPSRRHSKPYMTTWYTAQTCVIWQPRHGSYSQTGHGSPDTGHMARHGLYGSPDTGHMAAQTWVIWPDTGYMAAQTRVIWQPRHGSYGQARVIWPDIISLWVASFAIELLVAREGDYHMRHTVWWQPEAP